MFHQLKYPLWIEFLKTKGAIERAIDLFITFLIELNVDEEPYDYRIHLASFLTDLVCENNYIPNLAEQTIKSLYDKLNKIMKHCPPDSAVTIFRCIVRINDIWLDKATSEEKTARIKRIIDSAIEQEIIRGMALTYVQKFAGKIIPYRKIVNTLTKSNPSDIYLLQTIYKCAIDGDEYSRYYALKFFARYMTIHKYLMRTAANLFFSIMERFETIEEEIKWVPIFINMIFVYIKLATDANRYKGRVLLLCSILSSDITQKVPWLKNQILDSASSCCNKYPTCSFLSKFFPIHDTSSPGFEKALNKLTNLKFSLKFIPFRPNSLLFIEGLNMHKPKLKISEQEIKSITGEESSFELRPQSMKFVSIDYGLTKQDQKHNIEDLEEFISQTQDQFKQIRDTMMSKHYPDHNNFHPSLRSKIMSVNIVLKENAKKIYHYQKYVIDEFIDIASEIIDVSSKHRYLVANIKSMTKIMQSLLLNSNEYLTLKREKNIISRYAINLSSQSKKYIMENPQTSVYNSFQTGQRSANIKIHYLAPGALDENISEYVRKICLENGQNLSDFVKTQNVTSLVSDTYALSFVIIEDVNLDRNSDLTVPIIVNSLFRYAFDNAYNDESILNRYKEEDGRFLSICPKILSIDINNLKIRPEIIRKISVFKTVKGLLASCHHSLFHTMSYSNPVDISFELYKAICQLPNLANNPTLTNEESSWFLLFLICNDPPPNVFSISKFLKKFEQTVTSLELIVSMNIFHRSISLAFENFI
ncbi:hypothetical protein TVAG_433540 [Trichomonas vaginalis G3]|uniref:Uncharacterized protein n=1 Tax=Trichomonas vaginalis (strain ATCC PRA-98 / G3) TaxID=412133 RepID=A2FJH5_TRIV3|nr:hypothetical protein TVAGG3_0106860 [Trichomonas vaginalis G3]EAX94945.1 hypothetical protein TVAG_433540 [Trichomonas vaginalis G3]KAI5544724.1 hypothetical protein TVAGG3_0106860 [Trichomonas vaginalis G3]|eukprot:XP_001307875.1 hypothetical protein [Trichomonas vaginalis G3]